MAGEVMDFKRRDDLLAWHAVGDLEREVRELRRQLERKQSEFDAAWVKVVQRTEDLRSPLMDPHVDPPIMPESIGA